MSVLATGHAKRVENGEISGRRGLHTVCEAGHEDAQYEIELRAARWLQVKDGRLEIVGEHVFEPHGNERRRCTYEIVVHPLPCWSCDRDEPCSVQVTRCDATVQVILP